MGGFELLPEAHSIRPKFKQGRLESGLLRELLRRPQDRWRSVRRVFLQRNQQVQVLLRLRELHLVPGLHDRKVLVQRSQVGGRPRGLGPDEGGRPQGGAIAFVHPRGRLRHAAAARSLPPVPQRERRGIPEVLGVARVGEASRAGGGKVAEEAEEERPEELLPAVRLRAANREIPESGKAVSVAGRRVGATMVAGGS